MRWILDAFYLALVVVVGPFWAIRRLWRRRPMPPLLARFGWIAPLPAAPSRVWVHGVSVGEVLAARGIVAALRAQGHDVLISSTTVAGLATARQHFGAEHVREGPLDFSCSVRRFLKRVRPQALVLLELELWPNTLLACSAANIPVMLANGKLSQRSLRGWRRVVRVMPKLLRPVRMFAVQSEEHAARFRSLGVAPERIQTCGNLKFDNVVLKSRDAEAARQRERLGFPESAPVVVAGSTHAGEEEILLGAIVAARRVFPELRLVLAPRHLERLPVVLSAAAAHGRVGLLTRASECRDAVVVVVDTMGELATLYALADLAFVGGTLVPVGGHNLLEPAAFGVPIFTGPHIGNVQALGEELVHEGVMSVMTLSSVGECENMINSILQQQGSGQRARAGAARVFAAHSGSLPRTMQAMAAILPALTKESVCHG